LTILLNRTLNEKVGEIEKANEEAVREHDRMIKQIKSMSSTDEAILSDSQRNAATWEEEARRQAAMLRGAGVKIRELEGKIESSFLSHAGSNILKLERIVKQWGKGGAVRALRRWAERGLESVSRRSKALKQMQRFKARLLNKELADAAFDYVQMWSRKVRVQKEMMGSIEKETTESELETAQRRLRETKTELAAKARDVDALFKKLDECAHELEKRKNSAYEADELRVKCSELNTELGRCRDGATEAKKLKTEMEVMRSDMSVTLNHEALVSEEVKMLEEELAVERAARLRLAAEVADEKSQRLLMAQELGRETSQRLSEERSQRAQLKQLSEEKVVMHSEVERAAAVGMDWMRSQVLEEVQLLENELGEEKRLKSEALSRVSEYKAQRMVIEEEIASRLSDQKRDKLRMKHIETLLDEERSKCVVLSRELGRLYEVLATYAGDHGQIGAAELPGEMLADIVSYIDAAKASRNDPNWKPGSGDDAGLDKILPDVEAQMTQERKNEIAVLQTHFALKAEDGMRDRLQQLLQDPNRKSETRLEFKLEEENSALNARVNILKAQNRSLEESLGTYYADAADTPMSVGMPVQKNRQEGVESVYERALRNNNRVGEASLSLFPSSPSHQSTPLNQTQKQHSSASTELRQRVEMAESMGVQLSLKTEVEIDNHLASDRIKEMGTADFSRSSSLVRSPDPFENEKETTERSRLDRKNAMAQNRRKEEEEAVEREDLRMKEESRREREKKEAARNEKEAWEAERREFELMQKTVKTGSEVMGKRMLVSEASDVLRQASARDAAKQAQHEAAVMDPKQSIGFLEKFKEAEALGRASISGGRPGKDCLKDSKSSYATNVREALETSGRDGASLSRVGEPLTVANLRGSTGPSPQRDSSPPPYGKQGPYREAQVSPPRVYTGSGPISPPRAYTSPTALLRPQYHDTPVQKTRSPSPGREPMPSNPNRFRSQWGLDDSSPLRAEGSTTAKAVLLEPGMSKNLDEFAFENLDKNKDGVIDREEWKEVYVSAGGTESMAESVRRDIRTSPRRATNSEKSLTANVNATKEVMRASSPPREPESKAYSTISKAQHPARMVKQIKRQSSTYQSPVKASIPSAASPINRHRVNQRLDATSTILAKIGGKLTTPIKSSPSKMHSY